MGIFSYKPQKPGKGISKNEPKLRRPLEFFRIFFNYFWDFLKLSMLFCATCVPVITIPAAICGLTYLCKCYATETHAFLLSDYFEYFKKYFFRSFAMMFANFLTGFSLYTVWVNYKNLPQLQGFLLPLILINALILMMNFYFYPLLISYDISVWGVFKNSFIFAMVRFPVNFLIVLLMVAALAAAFGFYPVIGWLLTFFVLPGFLGFLATFSVWPSIEKNMSDSPEDGYGA